MGDSTVIDRINGAMMTLSYKAPVACATVGPITLAGAQTVSGVVLAQTIPPTRALVKNQPDPKTNGIYDVSNLTWSRSVDFDGAYDAATGSQVLDVSGQKIYYLTTTDNPVVFGTSLITFALIGDPFTSRIVTPFMYGAKGDAISVLDLIASGTDAHSATHTFVAADVGKAINILPAVGSVSYSGTITGFNASNGHAIVSPSISTPFSGNESHFFTDDYAAISTMATDAGNNNYEIWWLGKSYGIANPTPGTGSTIRQIIFTNSYQKGDGATVYLSHSNQVNDSGISLTFQPTNGNLIIEGFLNIDGEYVSRGAPQFSCHGPLLSSLAFGYVEINVRRTSGDGIAISGCKDVKHIGVVEDCGDMSVLNVNPTDSQHGRQFGINCTNNTGHIDLSGSVVRRAAQSGIFFQTTSATASINVRGSKVEGCGFFNYDFERCACVMDFSGAQSVQDGTLARDYSHTYGGLIISDTANRICDVFTSKGSGQDFIHLSNSSSDANKLINAKYGIISAIASTVQGVVYIYSDYEGAIRHTTTVGEIYADSITLGGGGIALNNTKDLLSSGLWVGKITRSGNFSNSPDTFFTTAVGGNFWVHVREGDLGQVSVNNTTSARGAILLDLGAGVNWKAINNNATGECYATNLEKPLGWTVQKFNAAKNVFPFDDTLNVGGVTAHWSAGGIQAGLLNVINTANNCAKSIALDPGRLYMVGPLLQYKDYNKLFIGAAANIAGGSNVTVPSSGSFARIYSILSDWLALSSPAALAIGVPTGETTTGTTASYIKEFPVWEFFTIGASGLEGQGPMAADRAGWYGTLYNTVRTNDT